MSESSSSASGDASAQIASHRTVHLDGPGGGHDLVIRPLESADDYARGESLQRATWGDGHDFDEITSATMMLISQKVGGIAAGAFDEEGTLRGFVFGLTGLKDGRPTHWSHMLAVDPPYGGYGLGRQLKSYQRDQLLALGVERMLWTYDPLVARNAHLNLNRLGAEPIEYHVNLYGEGDKNALHRGLGTDRFVVEWRLDSAAVDQALRRNALFVDGNRLADAPRVNSDDQGRPRTDDFPLPDAPVLRIEVPYDVQTLKTDDPDQARDWRTATRRAFVDTMGRGYRIRSLVRDGGRCYYVLEAPAS